MNKIRCLFPLEPKEAKALHTRFFPVESMVCVCQYFGLLLKADGHVELIGQPDDKAENWKPFRAEDWTDVVKLYKSDKHIAGLKKDGTVTACGCNDKQQCETGDWRNIREIYISEDATIGIDRNGTARYTYAFQTVSTPTPPPAPAQGIPSPVMPATAVPSPAPAKPPVQNTNSAVGHTTAPAEKKAPSPKTDTPADPSYPKATSSIWFQHRKNANGNITITKYIGPEKNVVIPCAIKGKAVTHIGARAFHHCSLLTSVTIPDSVTYIGEWAFWGCDNLTSINMPKNISTIRNRAFLGCSRLTAMTLPEGIKSIEEGMFTNCTNLTSLWIPDSVKKIEYGAFIGCLQLTLYGNSGSHAQRYAKFNKLPFRAEPIPENNASAVPTLPKATNEKLFLYDVSRDGTVVIRKYIGPEKNVVIPCAIKGKAVTHIGARAFKGCTLLNTVVIPDSVIKIGANAFDGCTGLTSVILSKGVKNTGDFAFYGCTSLLSVTIPDGVTAIGPYAFKQCRSMVSVTLPDSVTQIGDSAFEKCAKLVSVVIPKSVTHIGNFAFNGCTNLTVYGSYFSYADKYAEEQRIPFSRLC